MDVFSAAWTGNLRVLQNFAEEGPSIFLQPDTSEKGKKFSALHYSAYAGKLDAVKFMLYVLAGGSVEDAMVYAVSPNFKPQSLRKKQKFQFPLTVDGCNPVYLSSQQGHVLITQVLIYFGDDPRVVDRVHGFNAFDIALNKSVRKALVGAEEDMSQYSTPSTLCSVPFLQVHYSPPRSQNNAAFAPPFVPVAGELRKPLHGFSSYSNISNQGTLSARTNQSLRLLGAHNSREKLLEPIGLAVSWSIEGWERAIYTSDGKILTPLPATDVEISLLIAPTALSNTITTNEKSFEAGAKAKAPYVILAKRCFQLPKDMVASSAIVTGLASFCIGDSTVSYEALPSIAQRNTLVKEHRLPYTEHPLPEGYPFWVTSHLSKPYPGSRKLHNPNPTLDIPYGRTIIARIRVKNPMGWGSWGPVSNKVTIPVPVDMERHPENTHLSKKRLEQVSDMDNTAPVSRLIEVRSMQELESDIARRYEYLFPSTVLHNSSIRVGPHISLNQSNGSPAAGKIANIVGVLETPDTSVPSTSEKQNHNRALGSVPYRDVHPSISDIITGSIGDGPTAKQGLLSPQRGRVKERAVERPAPSANQNGVEDPDDSSMDALFSYNGIGSIPSTTRSSIPIRESHMALPKYNANSSLIATPSQPSLPTRVDKHCAPKNAEFLQTLPRSVSVLIGRDDNSWNPVDKYRVLRHRPPPKQTPRTPYDPVSLHPARPSSSRSATPIYDTLSLPANSAHGSETSKATKKDLEHTKPNILETQKSSTPSKKSRNKSKPVRPFVPTSTFGVTANALAIADANPRTPQPRTVLQKYAEGAQKYVEEANKQAELEAIQQAEREKKRKIKSAEILRATDEASAPMEVKKDSAAKKSKQSKDTKSLESKMFRVV